MRKNERRLLKEENLRLKVANAKLVNALSILLQIKEMEESGLRYIQGAGLTWNDALANARAALREANETTC